MYYSSGFSTTLMVLFFMILLISLAINAFACDYMIQGARQKGHYANGEGTGMLWAIALLSPLGIVAVGLITASLPDLKMQRSLQALQDSKAANYSSFDELPTV